jgi:hypothetical protein
MPWDISQAQACVISDIQMLLPRSSLPNHQRFEVRLEQVHYPLPRVLASNTSVRLLQETLGLCGLAIGLQNHTECGRAKVRSRVRVTEMLCVTAVGGLCHNLRTIQLVSPLGTRDQLCHVCLGAVGVGVVGTERSHIVFKAIGVVKLSLQVAPAHEQRSPDVGLSRALARDIA